MAFHLATLTLALDLAREAATEAHQQLEECQEHVLKYKNYYPRDTLHPDKEDLRAALAAITRLRRSLAARSDTAAQQLREVQVNFLLSSGERQCRQHGCVGNA